MTVTISSSLSMILPAKPFSSGLRPISETSNHDHRIIYLSLASTTSPPNFSQRRSTDFRHRNQNILIQNARIWRISATESAPLDASQEVVSATGDDGVYTVIQVLLFAAFLALSVLTVGVVYIGVTDFLGKREREKFEKEEAAKKSKKGGKRKKARAKAGPRGFGQKIDEDEDDLD